jgi:hypothetical protein
LIGKGQREQAAKYCMWGQASEKSQKQVWLVPGLRAKKLLGAGLRGRPGRGGSKQAATLIGKGKGQRALAAKYCMWGQASEKSQKEVWLVPGLRAKKVVGCRLAWQACEQK